MLDGLTDSIFQRRWTCAGSSDMIRHAERSRMRELNSLRRGSASFATIPKELRRARTVGEVVHGSRCFKHSLYNLFSASSGMVCGCTAGTADEAFGTVEVLRARKEVVGRGQER